MLLMTLKRAFIEDTGVRRMATAVELEIQAHLNREELSNHLVGERRHFAGGGNRPPLEDGEVIAEFLAEIQVLLD